MPAPDPHPNVIAIVVVVTMAAFCLGAAPALTDGDGNATCGQVCANNNECTSSECPRCHDDFALRQPRECRAGFGCGGYCNDDFTNCDQQHNCTGCQHVKFNYICVPQCLQKCATNEECYARGCHECFAGQCLAAVCSVGSQCTNATGCSDEHCAYCNIAPSASVGSCTTRCGMDCFHNRDCPMPCPNCVQNQCIT
jgi:hypothetical protein